MAAKPLPERDGVQHHAPVPRHPTVQAEHPREPRSQLRRRVVLRPRAPAGNRERVRRNSRRFPQSDRDAREPGARHVGHLRGITFTLPDKDLAQPYAQQWHLTVERQLAGGNLVSAAYVGTKGTKLLRLTTPKFGPIPTTILPLIVSGSTTAYPDGAPIIARDSLHLRRERADANFDVRHRVAASFLYDLPFYRGETGAAATLLGGWQVASIFQTSTGQPFTLNVAFDANLDGNLTDRPSTTDGLTFLDGHGPRRVALAPGLGAADFVVLTETQNLELRSEFFDALNRTNFGLPVRVIGSPGFGTAVETATPNRVIQFALKYSF